MRVCRCIKKHDERKVLKEFVQCCHCVSSCSSQPVNKFTLQYITSRDNTESIVKLKLLIAFLDGNIQYVKPTNQLFIEL